MLPDRAETEVWFRNAGAYIIQLAEVGCYNVVFDAAYVLKRKIDPVAYCAMYFGSSVPWRCIVIHPDRSILYDRDSEGQPAAVWPTWSARQSELRLATLMKNPWGDDGKFINNEFLDASMRPVAGQRHLIVITDLPSMVTAAGKQFMMDLGEFQEQHPEVTFFIHGAYSYQSLFGNGFKAVDWDARTMAAKGEIFLPGGRHVYPDELKRARYWIEILGYDQIDLKDPKMRCKYNIKSAIFAGTYWNHLRRFAVNRERREGLDWDTPQMEAHIKENSLVFTNRLVARPGDRVLCDDCSLWMSCKYYREGAVCAVSTSDMGQIAELFGTRDSGKVQQALTALVQANTQRIERGMRAEATPLPGKSEEDPSIEREVDPALSRLITDTFKMGDRLLQIIDPSMRPGKPAVNVNVGGGAQRVEITQTGSDDQQMVSSVIGMLEARGFTRDQITPDMVNMALNEIAGMGQKAIPGEVSS